MLTDESSILDDIVDVVKNYSGLIRKREIRLISELLPDESPEIIAARGEDAAVISENDRLLLLAADGIMDDLTDKAPRWAGYCSILVNVNDILAMRGRPLAAVNVISAINDATISEIARGMREACEKFDVKMVGGHLHPKATKNDISVAMLGICDYREPLLSSTAEPGETIFVLIDCEGEFTPGIPYSWDSTSKKSKDVLSELFDRIRASQEFFSSGKDISNPGLLGTLAMLLEASNIGAQVSIRDIPKPSGVDLLQWLTAYQGLGFVGTASEDNMGRISEEIEDTGLSFSRIGRATEELEFKIEMGNEERVLFDLSKERITGLFIKDRC